MKNLFALAAMLAAVSVAAADSKAEMRARAQAAYAASLADDPGPIGPAGPVKLEFDLTRVKNLPEQPAGYWQTVRVCDGNGYCHEEQRWVQSAAAPAAAEAVAAAVVASTGINALDEVNALRAARGMRPYIYDPNLEVAAKRCANVRAAALHHGHTWNDFAYLPPGVDARYTGCAAWEPSMGWGSCEIYGNCTYGGAAWTLGRDGRRYMHLFVR